MGLDGPGNNHRPRASSPAVPRATTPPGHRHRHPGEVCRSPPLPTPSEPSPTPSEPSPTPSEPSATSSGCKAVVARQ